MVLGAGLLGIFQILGCQAPPTRPSPEPGQQGQSAGSHSLFFPPQSVAPHMVKPKADRPPGSENLGI